MREKPVPAPAFWRILCCARPASGWRTPIWNARRCGTAA